MGAVLLDHDFERFAYPFAVQEVGTFYSAGIHDGNPAFYLFGSSGVIVRMGVDNGKGGFVDLGHGNVEY